MLKNKYLLVEKELRPFKDPTRGNFLNLTLQSKDGRVNGKVWEEADEVDEAVGEGDVLQIQAIEDEFKGEPQLNIKSIEPLWGEDSSQFLPSLSDNEIDYHYDIINESLSRVNDKIVRDSVREVFYDNEDLFTKSPASTYHHHAYIGGLVEHTSEVITIVEHLCYTFGLDSDLAVAGAVVHDIGKLQVYSWDRGFFEFTEKGLAVDHIVAGYELCAKYSVPREILHIVLSHHGKKEWGSPVVPNTIEAWVVHYADFVSSRLAKEMEG